MKKKSGRTDKTLVQITEKEFVRETRQERSRRRADERIARVPQGFYRTNPDLYEAFKKGTAKRW